MKKVSGCPNMASAVKHLVNQGAWWPGGSHLGLQIQRSGVRGPLGSPCCVLEQDIFSPKKVLVIPRKRWLRPNITENYFTGTLSTKPNQNQNLVNQIKKFTTR